MIIPIDTAKYYPSPSQQMQARLLYISPKFGRLVTEIRQAVPKNRIFSDRELKEHIATTLYSKTYNLFELKPTDNRTQVQMAEHLFNYLRPDNSKALGIYFPGESSRKIRLDNYLNYIHTNADR